MTEKKSAAPCQTKVTAYYSGFPHTYVCAKPSKVEIDGTFYCTIHDPKYIEARRKKANAKADAVWEEKKRIWEAESLGRWLLLFRPEMFSELLKVMKEQSHDRL